MSSTAIILKGLASHEMIKTLANHQANNPTPTVGHDVASALKDASFELLANHEIKLSPSQQKEIEGIYDDLAEDLATAKTSEQPSSKQTSIIMTVAKMMNAFPETAHQRFPALAETATAMASAAVSALPNNLEKSATTSANAAQTFKTAITNAINPSNRLMNTAAKTIENLVEPQQSKPDDDQKSPNMTM